MRLGWDLHLGAIEDSRLPELRKRRTELQGTVNQLASDIAHLQQQLTEVRASLDQVDRQIRDLENNPPPPPIDEPPPVTEPPPKQPTIEPPILPPPVVNEEEERQTAGIGWPGFLMIFLGGLLAPRLLSSSERVLS